MTVSMISGGIALVDEAGRSLVPQCCGDLGAWREWQRALQSGADWSPLWIGHPWVAARRCGPNLEISQLHESADADLHTAWVLDAGVAARELDRIVAELTGFAAVLESFVAESLGAPNPDVARTMAGLSADVPR